MPADILIADDDRNLAQALARLVEGAGLAPRVVHDGVAALEEIHKAPPRAVVLDLLLPRKDGRAVLADIRGGARTADIPVVVISGVFRGATQAREISEAGASAFLQKPFTGAELLARLKALLPQQETASRGAIAINDTPVAEVLLKAMSARFSGAVHFRQGKLQKLVVMKQGRPIKVRSNSALECLGRRLFEKGRIEREALDESLRRSRVDGLRQGEALVELGVISREEVDEELRLQSEEKLFELFRWRGGDSWLQPGVEDAEFATDVAIPPAALVLRGVEQMQQDVIEPRLAPVLEVELGIQEAALGPEERAIPNVARLLAAVQPGVTGAELAQLAPRTLYGLVLIGALAPRKGVANTQNDSPKLKELRALSREYAAKSYLEILAVSATASPNEIKQAFVALAKRFHPDRYRTEADEVRAAATQLFSLISTAQDTLLDPARRRQYLHELQGGASRRETQSEAKRLLEAEQMFRRGEQLVRSRDYPGAVRVLAKALELSPDEGEIHALYGWALFLVNRDDDAARTRAIRHLEQATALAQASATPLYYLGQLRKACGELGEALRMFRKVVDLQPNHVEANRELRLLQMRSSKDQSGLFGFGRKKR
jgi:DNA-binding response OmpR family regulator/DnaJ-domain-containing protein 1